MVQGGPATEAMKLSRERNTLMQKMPVVPRDDLDQEALKERLDISVLRVRCSWLDNWLCDGQHADSRSSVGTIMPDGRGATRP